MRVKNNFEIEKWRVDQDALFWMHPILNLFQKVQVEELKKIIKNSTSVLVLEDGEPSFVVLDYKTYKEMVSSDDSKEVKLNHPKKPAGEVVYQSDRELEILERLNKEIQALKSQIETEEKSVSNSGID